MYAKAHIMNTKDMLKVSKIENSLIKVSLINQPLNI